MNKDSIEIQSNRAEHLASFSSFFYSFLKYSKKNWLIVFLMERWQIPRLAMNEYSFCLAEKGS
jgi:hypothetical protein